MISTSLQMSKGIGCSDRHNVIHEIYIFLILDELQHVSEVFSTYHQHREIECQNTKIYKYCSEAYHCTLYTMPQKIQLIKTQEECCIFLCILNHTTNNLPMKCGCRIDYVGPCIFLWLVIKTIISSIPRKYK